MQKQFRLKKRAAFAYVYRKGEKNGCKGLVAFERKIQRGIENRVVRVQKGWQCRHSQPRQEADSRGVETHYGQNRRRLYVRYRGISVHCRERFFLGVEVGRASVFTCGETQMIKRFCLFLLLLYKRTLSPITGNHCAYTPTCSMYSYDAISKYGAFVGILLTIERLLRCTPFAKGGFDPVRENYRGKTKWLI